jgi:hypothetical protein
MLFPQILPGFQEKLCAAINKLLSKLDAGLCDSDCHDYSVYTGTSGVASLYFLLSKRQNNSSYAKVRPQDALLYSWKE